MKKLFVKQLFFYFTKLKFIVYLIVILNFAACQRDLCNCLNEEKDQQSKKCIKLLNSRKMEYKKASLNKKKLMRDEFRNCKKWNHK